MKAEVGFLNVFICFKLVYVLQFLFGGIGFSFVTFIFFREN